MPKLNQDMTVGQEPPPPPRERKNRRCYPFPRDEKEREERRGRINGRFDEELPATAPPRFKSLAEAEGYKSEAAFSAKKETTSH